MKNEYSGDERDPKKRSAQVPDPGKILDESACRFRHLVDVLPHGVLIVNSSGRIVYCNQASAKLYGYEQKEIVGKFVWDLLALDADSETSRRKWNAVFRERPYPGYFRGRGRTRDGASVQVRLDTSYEHDSSGALAALYCTVTDVSPGPASQCRVTSIEPDDGLTDASRRTFREIDSLEELPIASSGAVERSYPKNRSVVGTASAHLDAVQELCRRPAQIAGVMTDANEREQARTALEEAQRRLEEIVKEMPVLMEAFDENGRVVMWNQECERVTGYAAHDILGRPDAMELLYPDAEKRLDLLTRRSPSGERNRESEWPVRCKDGSTKIVAWSVAGPRAQIPDWWVWRVGIDVTERRRAELALRESEEMFRSITESSPNILIVVGIDGKVRFINRTIERPKDEILGNPAFDFLSEPYKSRLKRCFRQARVSGQPQRLDVEYRSKRFSLQLELTVVPIFHGGAVTAFAVSANDVTERRQAEARFRAQYQHLPLPTYTWQRREDDFVLVDSNEAGRRATAGRVAALIGKPLSEIYRDSPQVLEDFAKCYRDKGSLRKEQRYRFRTRDDERDMDVTYTFVPPDLVMVHADDITERKAAQMALEDALDEKETLLREVHHRVKNNLQVISSLLYLQTQKVTESAIAHVLRDMDKRVRTMALIHENLYRSSDLRRVNFREYLQDLASDLVSTLHQTAIKVETDLEEGYLPIESAVTCGLIVNELVTNGVTHAFPDRQGTLRVAFSRGDRGVTVVISDDGVGLPEDVDLENSNTLGLRLVTRLTDQLGGTITVKRECGTQFVVSFPT